MTYWHWYESGRDKERCIKVTSRDEIEELIRGFATYNALVTGWRLTPVPYVNMAGWYPYNQDELIKLLCKSEGCKNLAFEDGVCIDHENV